MKVEIEPGRYILAVSGGVDSMVLLDIISSQYALTSDHQFVVAHFDHGIRQDSGQDKELVEKKASEAGLQFEYAEGHLGEGASEAFARNTRYAFLRSLQRKYRADAIVTAHHQDDVIETAVINTIRGTNRKGLTALRSKKGVIRPLLDYSKEEISRYAKVEGVVWREDSTNQSEAYLRNYIRLKLVPKLGESGKQKLLQELDHLAQLNDEIDSLLSEFIKSTSDTLSATRFRALPNNLSKEVIAALLRKNEIRDVDSRTIQRLVIAGKTAAPGTTHEIRAGWQLVIGRKALALQHRER